MIRYNHKIDTTRFSLAVKLVSTYINNFYNLGLCIQKTYTIFKHTTQVIQDFTTQTWSQFSSDKIFNQELRLHYSHKQILTVLSKLTTANYSVVDAD